MKITAILLAAGQGTRMKSDLPKVLHPIAGKPMLWHALKTIEPITTVKPVVIVGHGADQVVEFLGKKYLPMIQEPQMGTAHAVMQAERALKGNTDLVLVCYADMPLLRTDTLKRLIETQTRNRGPFSILTVSADDPRGFGRVLRAEDGSVKGIIEEAVATPEQLQIKELNVGTYCFNADWLWNALPRIPKNPRKGEYYLTDAVELAVSDGLSVQAVVLEDTREAIGINSRVHLAEAERLLRAKGAH